MTAATATPRCYHCWRDEYLTYDGTYWTACRACGKRSTPGQIKKTIRQQKERAR